MRTRHGTTRILVLRPFALITEDKLNSQSHTTTSLDHPLRSARATVRVHEQTRTRARFRRTVDGRDRASFALAARLHKRCSRDDHAARHLRRQRRRRDASKVKVMLGNRGNAHSCAIVRRPHRGGKMNCG